MGNRAKELTAQIAESRGSLGSDLDELQDKVSPAAIVDRQKQAAKAKVSGVRSKIMGQVNTAGDAVPSTSDLADAAQDRFDGAPLAAGIAAFGLGMVIAALIPASEAETKVAAQVVDTANTQAQPLIEDAKQAATDIGANLKDTATDAGTSVKETATDAATRVQEEGAGSVEAVRSETQG